MGRPRTRLVARVHRKSIATVSTWTTGCGSESSGMCSGSATPSRQFPTLRASGLVDLSLLRLGRGVIRVREFDGSASPCWIISTGMSRSLSSSERFSATLSHESVGMHSMPCRVTAARRRLCAWTSCPSWASVYATMTMRRSGARLATYSLATCLTSERREHSPNIRDNACREAFASASSLRPVVSRVVGWLGCRHFRERVDVNAIGRSDAGMVGGIEALPFGLLVFVVGALLVANAWAVVDAKFAVDAAARQATRSYVEAEVGGARAADAGSVRDAEQIAIEAGMAALTAHGRDPRQPPSACRRSRPLADSRGSPAAPAPLSPPRTRSPRSPCRGSAGSATASTSSARTASSSTPTGPGSRGRPRRASEATRRGPQ